MATGDESERMEQLWSLGERSPQKVWSQEDLSLNLTSYTSCCVTVEYLPYFSELQFPCLEIGSNDKLYQIVLSVGSNKSLY